ncbi:aminoglycoside phosphotransferase family protein [Kiloniella antarctica]|uniref:Aminoglycoside phosphotransferase family protein n=1 Tax=Kiloniella antarctica TaxID=1550907 RepID=A0ABW5BQJ2_9PROT
MQINPVQREKERIDFVKSSGWEEAEISALPVDASARCYFRLSKNGETRILMDAPPGVAEPVEVFAKVARHLLSCGISVPVIYEESIEKGFLLLEDFGEKTYAKLLAAGGSEEELYALAVDVLVKMHSSAQLPEIEMPPYDLAFFIREALIMVDWYYPTVNANALTSNQRQSFIDAWCEIFNNLPCLPTTLVLRDFHIDNLMILEGRDGVASCGLLDFQTAVLGPAPYDLMSLVEDARRDIVPKFRTKMISRYLSSMGEVYASPEAQKIFMDWFYVLSAQRHAKVLGLFARLNARDNKSVYLQHIPRVSNLMTGSLEQEILSPVRNWFEMNFPDFKSNLVSIDRNLVQSLASTSEQSVVELTKKI